MKIRQNSPDLLIVEFVPWLKLACLLAFMAIWVACAVVFLLDRQYDAVVLFLALGTLIPMVFIWAFVARSQLVLDRAAGTVEIRRRSFRGFTRQPFPIDAIARVYVGQNGHKKAQVYLHVSRGMDAGHHAFPQMAATPAKAIAARDAIAEWLGLPQT